jgi:hypothetical protein
MQFAVIRPTLLSVLRRQPLIPAAPRSCRRPDPSRCEMLAAATPRGRRGLRVGHSRHGHPRHPTRHNTT